MKERKRFARSIALTAGLFCLSAAAGLAYGQDNASAPGTGLTDRLSAGISVGEIYNDNVYATRADRKSDWITTIAPYLGLQFGDNEASINVGASAEQGVYSEYSDEDYLDYRFYANGRFLLTPELLLFTSVSQAHNHEDRSSPDDADGSVPAEYDLTSGVAAILKRFGQTSVKLGATYDRYDFDDAGIVNNDDRDRQVFTGGARIEHRTSDSTRVFGEFTYDGRDYRTKADTVLPSDYKRDSDGVRAIAGVVHRFSPGLDGEIYAGWMYQNYEAGVLQDVSEPDFGGRLNWRPDDDTALIFDARRSIQETTVDGASSYVLTQLTLDWQHWVRENLRLDAGVRYSVDAYQGIPRTDHQFGASLGLRRYLNPHTYLSVGYAFSGRQSDDIIQNFNQSSVMVRLGADLQPAFDEETTSTNGASPDGPVALEPESQSNLYFGIATGLVTTGTWLEGPRGAEPGGGGPPDPGSLQADFADYGTAGKMIAGYGHLINDWYFGLEGDVSIADAEWNHSRLPGGRVFSVKRNWAAGVSALAGRRLAGGSLLYSRASMKFTEFDTDYQTPSGNRFDDTQTKFGLGLGIGGEAPVSSNIKLRMEYDYTAFDDYRMAVPSGTDIFANNESGMWLGVVYSLQDGPLNKTPSGPTDFSGYYAGVQAGHGALLSNDTTGPRTDDSTLVADFGDTGFTGGAFAGYNAQFNRWVFGGELVAELSDVAWDHEREPTGRSFSLEKKYSLGASLRAGYVLGQAALLYARAGIVHSGLEYSFRRGMTAVNTDLCDTGLRFGMGMEMPMTEQLNVRLDFSHTDYGRQVVLVPGPDNGEERFDAVETLFRVGTVYRF